MRHIQFLPRISPIQKEFVKRVNAQIKFKTGDWFLHYVITPIAFILLFVPFLISISLDIPKSIYLFTSIFTGSGMILVGTCVVHDANHNVFSSKK